MDMARLLCRHVPGSGAACAVAARSVSFRPVPIRGRATTMRRMLLALSLLAFGGCETTSSSSAPAPTEDAGADSNAPTSKGVELLGVIDLPRTSSTESLSATHYDPKTRTLHAL